MLNGQDYEGGYCEHKTKKKKKKKRSEKRENSYFIKLTGRK